MSLAPFAALEDRLNQSVARHLANATIQLVSGTVEIGAVYDQTTSAESDFSDVATVAQHTVSACVIGLGAGVTEGAELTLRTRQWPTGQLCRVTTPVVPDAGGWASFVVVPLEGDNDV